MSDHPDQIIKEKDAEIERLKRKLDEIVEAARIVVDNPASAWHNDYLEDLRAVLPAVRDNDHDAAAEKETRIYALAKGEKGGET